MVDYPSSMLFRRTPTHQVVTIGDSVLDTFLRIEEATVACQIKKDDCLLCFKFGEKLPLKSITRIPAAGNASNIAIGASRLGWNAAIVSILGQDAIGQEILQRWKAEGVQTRYVTHDTKQPTNAHTVLAFQDERTILVYHQPRTYVLPKLKSTSWIYYTSLAKGHENMEKELLHWLAEHPETKLAFNPGTFQLQRGLKKLLPVLDHCHALFVNKQEAQRLLATQEDDVRLLLSGLRRHGPQIVVITDGPSGSWSFDGQTVLACPAFPGKAVERTGAGDSFALGFIHGLQETGSVSEGMRHGSAISSCVILKIGPHAGLPTKQELQQILKKHHKLQPKKL